MELTQLFQFKVLAESKTMTEAAERLHISQPALSSSLKRLETELGVQLFERRKNKLFLNEAGEKSLRSRLRRSGTGGKNEKRLLPERRKKQFPVFGVL